MGGCAGFSLAWYLWCVHSQIPCVYTYSVSTWNGASSNIPYFTVVCSSGICSATNCIHLLWTLNSISLSLPFSFFFFLSLFILVFSFVLLSLWLSSLILLLLLVIFRLQTPSSLRHRCNVLCRSDVNLLQRAKQKVQDLKLLSCFSWAAAHWARAVNPEPAWCLTPQHREGMQEPIPKMHPGQDYTCEYD